MEEQKEQLKNNNEPEVIFADISGEQEPTVIESMCVDCEQNGKTTIMLTNIPMFKEIIVTSFYCEHCGLKNTEVQFGGKIGDFASEISLKCTALEDFKRDVVRSEFSTIKIPELDFEIPNNKKGQVNNVEGFLKNTIDDLESEQEKRKLLWPDLHQQIANFIKTLEQVLEGKHFPFHFIIDDPAGNSFIKNPYFPKSDPHLQKRERVRTKEECEIMGFSIENEEQYEQERKEAEEKLKQKLIQEGIDKEKEDQDRKEKVLAHKINMCQAFDEDNAKEEALTFPIDCHCCLREGLNKMCVVQVPYFKEITIMSFNCEFCGAKNSDVKAGGGISEKGIRITLNVKGDFDLKRELFKSDTAGIKIPELDVELAHGTLNGVYTTVEGLLEKISDNLSKNNPFADSDGQFATRMDKLIADIEKLRQGDTEFTLILEDMCENSFIQNPNHPKEDTNCVAEIFERDDEMNDILGVADMKV